MKSTGELAAISPGFITELARNVNGGLAFMERLSEREVMVLQHFDIFSVLYLFSYLSNVRCIVLILFLDIAKVNVQEADIFTVSYRSLISQ